MDKIKDYEKMILEYKLQRNHYELWISNSALLRVTDRRSPCKTANMLCVLILYMWNNVNVICDDKRWNGSNSSGSVQVVHWASVKAQAALKPGRISRRKSWKWRRRRWVRIEKERSARWSFYLWPCGTWTDIVISLASSLPTAASTAKSLPPPKSISTSGTMAGWPLPAVTVARLPCDV